MLANIIDKWKSKTKIKRHCSEQTGRESHSTLIHMSIAAPLDLLTFGRYNFAAIENNLESTVREGNAQNLHPYTPHIL